MDIHKPKAAHSWREFLIEIGTIICGILIALGLEQAVDWSRTQRELSETREALRKEITANTRSALLFAAQENCLLTWSDRAVAWAKGGARPEPPVLFEILLSSTVWDASRAGVALRMPTDERLKLAGYYNLIDQHQKLSRQLDDAVVRVNRYAPLQRLDTAQAKSLIEELNAMKPLVAGHVVEDRFAILAAAGLGVGAKGLVPEVAAPASRICGPLGGVASFEVPEDAQATYDWYTNILRGRAP